MNVRFFGGRKEEYVSIPKHNPIGLYFCADTRELFLGDKLLSDGLRVVSTFADLPSISEHKAAEGVIYFVAETKNGYVLPRGGYDWLQVIYAPEAGSSIKAISFAGIEMEEVDGVFTIDRRCAREALGFIVPEGMEDEELEIATKDYVDNQIAQIPGADLDLSDFVKQEDIAGLATKEELEEAISGIEHPTIDLEGYATEDWVNAQGFLKEHQDLSEYAKKSDIPEAELFIVDFAAPDFAAALEAYKNGKLLLLTNAAPDANGYAVMNYVRDDLITFTKFLMSRSGTYGSFNTYYLHNDNTWELAKEVKLNKVDAVVDENSDITGLTIGKNTYEFDNFATTETVTQITENIQNNYVTNETLEQKNYVTEQYVTNVTNNYITKEAAADTYVTNEQVTEVVTNEVETIIQEKVDSGEIEVKVDSISYGDFEDDLI